MTRQIEVGSVDQSVTIRIVDAVTGLPEEGVTEATPGLELWYRVGPTGAETPITPVAQTETGAHVDGGLASVNDGYYRLDLPDEVFASEATEVVVAGSADGMFVLGTTFAVVRLVGFVSAGDIGDLPATGECVDHLDIVSLDDLSAHPSGCSVPAGQEALYTGILQAAWGLVEDHYGKQYIPCQVSRCYRARCGWIPIDPFLTVTLVESSRFRCDDVCEDMGWTEVSLDDVHLGSDTYERPWRRLKVCTGTSNCGCGKSVRVTGLVGAEWPVSPLVKLVVTMIATKAARVMRSAGEVIANNEDGTTRFMLPDSAFVDELALLPRSKFDYEWRAV